MDYFFFFFGSLFEFGIKWIVEEERRVICKIDFKLMIWFCVMVSNSYNVVIYVEKLWLIVISFLGCNLIEEILVIFWWIIFWMIWV